MRGDLIELFKMFQGFDNVNVNNYLIIDNTNTTRNNGYKITGKRFRSDEAKHYFFNRIVNVWNSLPAHVVGSKTIEIFKQKLDNHLALTPQITYFGPA